MTTINSFNSYPTNSTFTQYKPKLLYYAVSDLIERGQIIHIQETKVNPEYIVINRKDFEKNEEMILKLSGLKPLSSFDCINHYMGKSVEDIDWYV